MAKTTILRFEKINSMTGVGSSGAHQHRHHSVTHNADPARRERNVTFIGSANRRSDVQSRLDTLTKPPRSNAVLAMDGLISLSPELFDESPDNLNVWANRTRDWLKKQFGENLVSAVIHLDELSPHIHFTVVPLDEKPDGRKVLNARDMFNKDALSGMQRSYNDEMKKYIKNVQGVKHGSKAKHTKIKHFYAELDAMSERLLDEMIQSKSKLINEASETIVNRLMPMIERQFTDFESKLGNPIPAEIRQELMYKYKKESFGILAFAFEESKTCRDWDKNITDKVSKERELWKDPEARKPSRMKM